MGRIIIAKGQYILKYINKVSNHTLAISLTMAKPAILNYVGVIQQPYGALTRGPQNGVPRYTVFLSWNYNGTDSLY